MKSVTIGCVIPTPGRKSLWRTIQSITSQGLISGDDILVVGDGLHKPTQRMITAVGSPFRYIPTQKTRTWGHDQENYGLKIVGGDMVILQGDDDEFGPRAFEVMRSLAANYPGAALLGRIKTPYRNLLWNQPGDSAVLDGHCLCVPNDKSKLGYAASTYDGDQTYLASSLAAYQEVYWADRIFTLTRQKWVLYPRLVGALQHTAPEGTRKWEWRFEEYAPTKRIVGVLSMWEREQDDTRIYGRCDGVTQHMPEIVEYAYWAAQGRDLWLRVSPEVSADLMRKKGFTEHEPMEWVGEWPPTFFTQDEEPQPPPDLVEFARWTPKDTRSSV